MDDFVDSLLSWIPHESTSTTTDNDNNNHNHNNNNHHHQSSSLLSWMTPYQDHHHHHHHSSSSPLSENAIALLQLCKGTAEQSAATWNYACQHEALRTLLERDPHCINVVDPQTGNSPLHWACSNPVLARDLKSILLLVETSERAAEEEIQQSSNNNNNTGGKKKNNNNNTNNMFRSKACLLSPTVAQVVRQKNYAGESPLHIACSSGVANSAVVAYLVRSCPAAVCMPGGKPPKSNVPLHNACEAVHHSAVPLKLIWILVQQWPEALQQANGEGNLPIHIASQLQGVGVMATKGYEAELLRAQRQLDIVQYLVNHSPESIHKRNKKGQTPLQIALRGCKDPVGKNHHLLHHEHPIVEFLQDFGRKYDQRNITSMLQHSEQTQLLAPESTTESVSNNETRIRTTTTSSTEESNVETMNDIKVEDTSKAEAAPAAPAAAASNTTATTALNESLVSKPNTFTTPTTPIRTTNNNTIRSTVNNTLKSPMSQSRTDMINNLIDDLIKERQYSRSVESSHYYHHHQQQQQQYYRNTSIRNHMDWGHSSDGNLAYKQQQPQPPRSTTPPRRMLYNHHSARNLIHRNGSGSTTTTTTACDNTTTTTAEETIGNLSFLGEGSESSITTSTTGDLSFSSDDEELLNGCFGSSTEHEIINSFQNTLLKGLERLGTSYEHVDMGFEPDYFACQDKVKNDYNVILRRYNTHLDDIDANLRAANHIVHQFYQIHKAFCKEKTYKDATTSADAKNTPLGRIYSDMEKCLLSKLTIFSTLQLKNLSDAQANQMLNWYEKYLKRLQIDLKLKIKPSTVWRIDCKRLMEHYLVERGVRKEIRDALIERRFASSSTNSGSGKHGPHGGAAGRRRQDAISEYIK